MTNLNMPLLIPLSLGGWHSLRDCIKIRFEREKDPTPEFVEKEIDFNVRTKTFEYH